MIITKEEIHLQRCKILLQLPEAAVQVVSFKAAQNHYIRNVYVPVEFYKYKLAANQCPCDASVPAQLNICCLATVGAA